LANWTKDVEGADSPESVLAVVNDYLRTLPSGVASWLPRASLPSGPLAQPEEIHAWHEAIATECDKPGAMYNGRLQEHAVIFMCASHRLHDLAAAPRRGGSKKPSSSESSSDPR